MTRVARREATEDHTLTFPRSEGFFRVSAFSPPFQRKFFAPGSLIDRLRRFGRSIRYP